MKSCAGWLQALLNIQHAPCGSAASLVLSSLSRKDQSNPVISGEGWETCPSFLIRCFSPKQLQGEALAAGSLLPDGFSQQGLAFSPLQRFAFGWKQRASSFTCCKAASSEVTARHKWCGRATGYGSRAWPCTHPLSSTESVRTNQHECTRTNPEATRLLSTAGCNCQACSTVT